MFTRTQDSCTLLVGTDSNATTVKKQCGASPKNTNKITIYDSEIPLWITDPRVQMTVIKKTNVKELLSRVWQKRNLIPCWWECILVCPVWKPAWNFSKRLKIGPACDPAISLLGKYSKDSNSVYYRDTWPPMSIAALLMIAKKCPQ